MSNVSPPQPNYGTVTGNRRSLESIYQELGVGKAQYLTWGVLTFAAFADYAEVFTIAVLVSYITPEWDLGLPFIVAMIICIYVCYGLGGLLLGIFSDKFGRRKVLLATTTMLLATGFVSALAPDQWVFLLARSLGGLCVGANAVTARVYSTEVASSEYKEVGICHITIMATFSFVFAAVVALVVLNPLGWRCYVIIVTLPAIVAVSGLMFLPESPRFLVASGDADKALKVIKKYFKWNGKSLAEGTVIKTYQDVERGDIRKLMKSNYLKETVLLSLMSFGNNLITYGLSVFVPLALGDNYCKQALAGTRAPTLQYQGYTQEVLFHAGMICFAGFVGTVIGAVLVRNVSRGRSTKAASVCTLMFTVLLFSVCITNSVATFCFLESSAMCFNIILSVMIPELYPTVIRNTGTGFVALCGVSGGVLGTGLIYVLYYINPYILVGVFFAAALLACSAAVFWSTETRYTAIRDVTSGADSEELSGEGDGFGGVAGDVSGGVIGG